MAGAVRDVRVGEMGPQGHSGAPARPGSAATSQNGAVVRQSGGGGFLWGGARASGPGKRGPNGAVPGDSKSVQSVQLAALSEQTQQGTGIETQETGAPATGSREKKVNGTETSGPRIFEAWEGDEKFFCGGRFISGPDWKMMLVTLGMVAVPMIIFITFVASDFGSSSYALVPISIIWALISCGSLLRTGLMDPGIIPRRPGWLPGPLQPGMSRVYEVYLNGGKAVQVRYNDTARLFQPPRAHHCSINDNCYQKFDHHCPWTGTTIALRNYRPFLIFVMGTLGLIVWTAVLCGLHIKKSADDVGSDGDPSTASDEAAARSAAAIALLIYCIPASMFLVPLTFFHCFLVSKNRTTYENFKFSQQAHPFDLGSVWRNWWSVCFATTPPPAVNFRAPASTLANFVWWNPGDPWEQKGQVLEADSEDEEEELGGDGAGGGPSEGPHGAAQGGDIEEGGGGDGASTASGAIKRFFRKSRAGTPGQSRPGTPGPGQSLSDASAPMGGEHVGVELTGYSAPRSEPGVAERSRSPSNVGESFLDSAQKVIRKSVGLFGWPSATDVSASAAADAQQHPAAAQPRPGSAQRHSRNASASARSSAKPV